nr:uncharacterized mitochondrial protein AtMg00810-like [Tanacetum cinerariifolium]
MITMGELTYFLGLQIKQDDKEISICQQQYTRNLLKKYEISDSSSVKTPMVPLNNLGFGLVGKPVNETLYRGQSKRITPNCYKKNLQVPKMYSIPWESWCTAIAYDPSLPEDDSVARPLKEFKIKFTLMNGKKPLTVDYKTFVEFTGLDYNKGTYVSHPSLEAVQAELAKIATDEVLVNWTPMLKMAFPMARRILFTLVIQELEASIGYQPLPIDASPTVLSPSYIADFDLKEDEEDPKEDPADHPSDE